MILLKLSMEKKMYKKLVIVSVLGLALAACCPTKKKMSEPVVLNVADRVFFDFDRSELRAEGRRVLDAQVEWFKNHPEENLVIEGHTDVRGSDSYNMRLGHRRANAARNYMVRRGLSPDRIRTVSYGESRPEIVNAKTAAEHQQNRRAVTVLD